MQDPKNNLSTSSSRKKGFYLLRQAFLFFLPVVMIFLFIEYLTTSIPMAYHAVGKYAANKGKQIEVMVFGTSQMQSAVNPEFIDKTTINYASSSQHHSEDFKILEQRIDTYPSMETVVFELSHAHLEIRHNSKKFWKNAIYLKYYQVNTFERNVYFKDKFLFISNPDFYSKNLYNYYLKKIRRDTFNQYGYNTSFFYGKFKNLDHDVARIAVSPFKIRTGDDQKIFKKNLAHFYKMIEFVHSKNKHVVICTLPLYPTYLKARNPNALKRRDSILKVIKNKYPTVTLLKRETDTSNFSVIDYRNENHLNPNGAIKFSKLLNNTLNKIK